MPSRPGKNSQNACIIAWSICEPNDPHIKSAPAWVQAIIRSIGLWHASNATPLTPPPPPKATLDISHNYSLYTRKHTHSLFLRTAHYTIPYHGHCATCYSILSLYTAYILHMQVRVTLVLEIEISNQITERSIKVTCTPAYWWVGPHMHHIT